MSKILIIMPYFGRWPEWIDLYFETVRRNRDVDFVFYTDCETDRYKDIDNVYFEKMSFADYLTFVNSKIDVEFNPPAPYKLCDLRPLYPVVHSNDIKGYDFYGWSDVDILFGNIRKFYTEEVLKRYDVLSTHDDRISGHFALFRNTERNRNMYKKIYNWKRRLTYPEYVGLDESGLTNAYTMTIVDKFNEKFKLNINNVITRKWKEVKKKKILFKEQYTTPFILKPWIDGSINSQQPDTWFYIDGKITNNRDDREFIYLHFMNFKSSQWRHDGTKAPWEGKQKICFAEPSDMKKGIIINSEGIYPIDLWKKIKK